jgi:hypothetical protein
VEEEFAHTDLLSAEWAKRLYGTRDERIGIGPARAVGMVRTILAGVIGGAVGELALNIVSYGDMFVRARPASDMPGKVAQRFADGLGIQFAQAGERPEKAEARREASGAILGYGMAMLVAVAFSVLRRLGLRLPVPIAGLAMAGTAMAISDSTATVLGVADPTEWGVAGWLSDIVPHAAYGIAAAATIELIES